MDQHGHYWVAFQGEDRLLEERVPNIVAKQTLHVQRMYTRGSSKMKRLPTSVACLYGSYQDHLEVVYWKLNVVLCPNIHRLSWACKLLQENSSE